MKDVSKNDMLCNIVHLLIQYLLKIDSIYRDEMDLSHALSKEYSLRTGRPNLVQSLAIKVRNI